MDKPLPSLPSLVDHHLYIAECHLDDVRGELTSAEYLALAQVRAIMALATAQKLIAEPKLKMSRLRSVRRPKKDD